MDELVGYSQSVSVLTDVLHEVRTKLHSNPWETIETSHGFAIHYGTDEEGAEYATIGFNVPSGIYAEIEDGTYGELMGFRIYRLPETIADIEEKVTSLFPGAVVEEDTEGQVVIYTGVTTDEDGNVILHEVS